MSRITPGTVIVGIFAVLFGLVGAYGVRKSLQRETPAPPAPIQPRPTIVPVASMDLEQGRVVVLHDIALHPMSEEQVAERQKDRSLPAAFMRNTEQIMGQTIRVPLKKGDAFTPDVFYPEGQGPTIAEKLDPGLRAVTISVDGTGALGGYDGPGSIVDVLFRTKAEAEVPEATVTLLEGVQVLAMEQAGARQPPGASLQNRVTLAVTAAQANALKIAEGRGTFSLALRNPEDVEVAAATVPQTLDRLLNLPVRREFVTQIYRGGGAALQATRFDAGADVPQPGVALPIAGALQIRAAQQTTSLEKQDQDAEAAKADVAEPAPAPPRPPAPSPSAASAAPASRPVKAPTLANNQATGTPPKLADDPSTVVSVQIPASVLLAIQQAGSAAANMPESRSLSAPPATPPPASAVNPDAGRSGTVPPSASRPKKVLSDIGRKYWDTLPDNRLSN